MRQLCSGRPALAASREARWWPHKMSKGACAPGPTAACPHSFHMVRRRHGKTHGSFGRPWISEGESRDFAHLALIKLPHRPLTLAHMSRVPLLHRRSAHPHRPVSPEVGDRARRLSARAGASRPLSSSRAPSTSPRRPQAARKPRARDRLALSPCDMRLHTCFAHAFAVALLRSGGASRASRRVNHLTLVSLTAAVL